MLLAILLVILISPFIRHAGYAGHIFTTLLTAMIPLISFYALTADRKRAIIILFIAVPFVILDGMSMLYTHRYLMIAAISFGTILYFCIIVLLVMNLSLNFRFHYHIQIFHWCIRLYKHSRNRNFRCF